MNHNDKTEKTSGESETEINRIEDEAVDLPAQHIRDIEKAKQEAEDNYNLYLRTLADAENGRKRLLKEVENSKKFALEGFFKDILVVLDGFDKALVTEDSGTMDSFNKGMSIVRKQLLDLLERNGLQQISAEGKRFDHNLHQAIKRTESAEVSEEMIECEYAKGYKMYDKLLRPAIVSVLVPKNED